MLQTLQLYSKSNPEVELDTYAKGEGSTKRAIQRGLEITSEQILSTSSWKMFLKAQSLQYQNLLFKKKIVILNIYTVRFLINHIFIEKKNAKHVEVINKELE